MTEVKPPIAHPIGLFMAGPTGAGGEYQPLERIRHDIFQRLPEGIVYGLAINADADAPTQDSMIIDITFDGKTTVHDPQKDHTIEQVADYPIDQATRGIVWFCPVQSPGYTRYSKVGKHTVTIKVAPRDAPTTGKHLESTTLDDGTISTDWVADSASQTLDSRDFSDAAGGKHDTFTFEIYPASDPIEDAPARDE
jgi:hypothetical protein